MGMYIEWRTYGYNIVRIFQRITRSKPIFLVKDSEITAVEPGHAEMTLPNK